MFARTYIESRLLVRLSSRDQSSDSQPRMRGSGHIEASRLQPYFGHRGCTSIRGEWALRLGSKRQVPVNLSELIPADDNDGMNDEEGLEVVLD